MDKTKVPLEMNPYNAMAILAFCSEFITEDITEYKFQAIKEAVSEMEMQLARNLTDQHWEEINAENKVNQLIGKSPKKKT